MCIFLPFFSFFLRRCDICPRSNLCLPACSICLSCPLFKAQVLAIVKQEPQKLKNCRKRPCYLQIAHKRNGSRITKVRVYKSVCCVSQLYCKETVLPNCGKYGCAERRVVNQEIYGEISLKLETKFWFIPCCDASTHCQIFCCLSEEMTWMRVGNDLAPLAATSESSYMHNHKAVSSLLTSHQPLGQERLSHVSSYVIFANTF